MLIKKDVHNNKIIIIMAMYISKNHLNSSIGRRMLNLQVIKSKKHNKMFTKEKVKKMCIFIRKKIIVI